jgi:hypothetical protein
MQHRTSVFKAISERPAMSALYTKDFGKEAINICFHFLGLTQPWKDT